MSIIYQNNQVWHRTKQKQTQTKKSYFTWIRATKTLGMIRIYQSRQVLCRYFYLTVACEFFHTQEWGGITFKVLIIRGSFLKYFKYLQIVNH